MSLLRPLLLFLLLPGLLAARTFTVLVYNVENLVDVDGKAVFDDYQPERYGRPHLLTKLKNISRVVASFEGGKGPDIILFQEIEADQTPGATPPDYAAILQRYAGTNIGTMLGSGFTPEIADLPAEALLLKAFHDLGLTGYHVVAGESVTHAESTNPLAQKCVTFTRFPVQAARSHPTLDARAILEVQVEVEGATLYLFNNHWKSGAGDPKSEPTRVANARTLRQRLDAILAADPQADIVIGGDFNSQYNQKQRYAAMKVTGMNDTLGSQGNELAIRGRDRDLYNLWFELPASQRGSDTFREEWGTLMQLLITRGLYDLRGVQYVDNSFGVTRLRGVNMDYLGLPNRWTFAGPAGGGFSDHFPVYAKFTVVPDNQPDRYVALQNAAQEDGTETVNRVDLSKVDLSKVAIVVRDLPKDASLRDGRHTGKVLLVDGEAGAGKNLTVRVRGDLYDVWCPDPALRDRLRESYEVGKRIRFYGELGQYKGRWQFVIRDRSWILK